MKKGIVLLVEMLFLCGIATAAGPTVSFMTEQIANTDYGNSLSVEVGYFLGVDEAGPGLECYAGTDWWPQWDDEGDMKPPGVVVLGVRQHMSDIVDPNSVVPFLPDVFLEVLNEDVTIKPYLGFRFSANLIDKDGGSMSIPAGVLINTDPDSKASLRFELRYNDTFGDLAIVPDNRVDAYMGLYIPF